MYKLDAVIPGFPDAIPMKKKGKPMKKKPVKKSSRGR